MAVPLQNEGRHADPLIQKGFHLLNLTSSLAGPKLQSLNHIKTCAFLVKAVLRNVDEGMQMQVLDMCAFVCVYAFVCISKHQFKATEQYICPMQKAHMNIVLHPWKDIPSVVPQYIFTERSLIEDISLPLVLSFPTQFKGTATTFLVVHTHPYMRVNEEVYG